VLKFLTTSFHRHPERRTMPENEEASATEAQQDVANASDTKAEATSTAQASTELSEDDLEAVAGGRGYGNVVGGPPYDPSAPVRARQPPGR